MNGAKKEEPADDDALQQEFELYQQNTSVTVPVKAEAKSELTGELTLAL